MGNSGGRRLTARVMALIIAINIVFPVNVAFTARPATLDTEVTVTGIDEGGTIDGSVGIEIKVAFPVPVEGDGGDDYFSQNDEVELLLSESFEFYPVPSSDIVLMYGGKNWELSRYTTMKIAKPSPKLFLMGTKMFLIPKKSVGPLMPM